MKKVAIALVFCGFIGCVSCQQASSDEPNWSLRVIATGDFRDQINSTPIELRPYRPLHFYGNTVRRQYYRGSAFALPRALPARQGLARGRAFGS